MKKIPVIIDVDTGIDDAMALVQACATDELDILAITTVGGNVALHHTTRNTLNILDMLGRGDIPVAKGAEKPLYRELFKASGVHGENGLRGWDFAENRDYALVKESAAEYMAMKINACPEKVTILALGPCTNVAQLLLDYPDIKDKIEKVIFMGASHVDGNPLIYSTFNVMVDPEAFEICMNTVPFYGCTLNATRTAYITIEERDSIKDLPGEVAKFVASIFGGYEHKEIIVEDGKEPDPTEERPKTAAQLAKSMKKDKYEVHDLATVAFAYDNSLFEFEKYYCEVETKGEKTYGMTIIDLKDYYAKSEEEKNFYYISKIKDREKFRDNFFKAIVSYNK